MSVTLTAEQVERLDEVSTVPLGFLHEMLDRFEGLEEQINGGKADLLESPAVPVA